MAVKPFQFATPTRRIVGVGWGGITWIEIVLPSFTASSGYYLVSRAYFPDLKQSLRLDGAFPDMNFLGNMLLFLPYRDEGLTGEFPDFHPEFEHPSFVSEGEFQLRFAVATTVALHHHGVDPGLDFQYLTNAYSSEPGGMISPPFTETRGPFATKPLALADKQDHPEHYPDTPPGTAWRLVRSEDNLWFWVRDVFAIFEEGSEPVVKGGFMNFFLSNKFQSVFRRRKRFIDSRGKEVIQYGPLRVDFAFDASGDANPVRPYTINVYSGGGRTLNGDFTISKDTGKVTPKVPYRLVASRTIESRPLDYDGADPLTRFSWFQGLDRIVSVSEADSLLKAAGFKGYVDA